MVQKLTQRLKSKILSCDLGYICTIWSLNAKLFYYTSVRSRLWVRDYKRREHSVVLLHVLWLCLDILHGWRSLSLLCMEGIVLLPKRDTGCWHLDWGQVTTWQCMNLFGTMWQFLKFGTLPRRSSWNLLSWNVGWWYSRDAYVKLAPLHKNNKMNRNI